MLAIQRPSVARRMPEGAGVLQAAQLERIDSILQAAILRNDADFREWNVYAALPGESSPRGGAIVVLRAEPRRPSLAPSFPWQHLHAVASRIATEVRGIGAVVPDVATPRPRLDDVQGSRSAA